MTIVLLSRPVETVLLVGADRRVSVPLSTGGWHIDDEATKLVRVGSAHGGTAIAALGDFAVQTALRDASKGNLMLPLSEWAADQTHGAITPTEAASLLVGDLRGLIEAPSIGLLVVSGWAGGDAGYLELAVQWRPGDAICATVGEWRVLPSGGPSSVWWAGQRREGPPSSTLSNEEAMRSYVRDVANRENYSLRDDEPKLLCDTGDPQVTLLRISPP